MANEYAVNQADLTSVANAIREKGGTENPLSFPAEFVTAIQNIEGGGGLNFEIVGGTQQPENPAENTIWVNTDTEITGWTFQATEPETPSDGMVCIFTGVSSPAPFNALKDNGITINPISAKQYVGGAWVNKAAKSYQGGEWVDWITWLYKFGDECTDITGGWESVALKYHTYAKELKVESISGGVKLTQTVGGYGGIYKTINKISLTNATAVHFTGSMKKVSANDVGFAIKPELGENIKGNAAVYFVTPTGTKDYNNEVIADVSGLTGDYYLCFYVCSTDGQYVELKELTLV